MVKHDHIILMICLMHTNKQKNAGKKGSDVFLLHLFQLSS